MRMLLLRLVACILLSLCSLPAKAQSPNTDTYFYTPGGGGVNGALGMCLNGVGKAVPCGSAGATLTASATGTTAATTATLPAAAGKTTYLCGFSIRGNATAAATGNATVTGTISGTMNFTQWTAPAASGIGITEPVIGPACIPASAVNTAISVISAPPGAGGVVSVSAWGYQL